MTTRFAFLVHPRARLAEDLARVHPALGRIPEPVYHHALRRLPVRPYPMATVLLAGERRGSVVLVPFGARHILAHPRAAAARVGRAVDLAVRQGASLVGLGALTAPATDGGRALAHRTDIGVTNGNAFTAAIVDDQVRRLLGDSADRHVAVVGATGSVGATVCRLLARDRAADRLTVVARGAARLAQLAGELETRVPTQPSSDLAAVREADLVVLLTCSAETILRAEHLGEGALVLDATQPRNTSPSLLRERPDVRVVDGGLVRVPSLRLAGGDIGLPDGTAYACFSETALLALAGHRGHFSLGVPTLEQVHQIRAIAADHAHLGFRLAPPTSFGRPVSIGCGVAEAAA